MDLLDWVSLWPRLLRRLIVGVFAIGCICFPAQIAPVVMGVIEREAAAITAPVQRMMEVAIQRASESATPVVGCTGAARGSRARSSRAHRSVCSGRARAGPQR
jgi:hypothetical protein